MATVTTAPDWLTGRDAAALLNVPSHRNVRRLADRGMIGVRKIPGVRAIYSRADVEALRASSVLPAQPQR